MLIDPIQELRISEPHPDSLPEAPDSFIYPHWLNNVRFINKTLEAINCELETGAELIITAQTNDQRKKGLFRRHSAPIAELIRIYDFIGHRVIPKLPLMKKAYFIITRGRNRPLAYSEILGRLISCGFRIEEVHQDDEETRITAIKVSKPVYDHFATYGPLIRLSRTGLNGQPITVLKFRTMHPYSEYAQEYLHNAQGLARSGKFKDDYRITSWGRVMRKLWIDELPMLINFFRGDLKLVGVRPLSKHYLGLYPEDFAERRRRYKPGLIPPFYADRPEGLENIVKSECVYLDAYDKHPWRTDAHYFFKVFWEIVVGGSRSG